MFRHADVFFTSPGVTPVILPVPVLYFGAGYVN